MSPMEMEKVTVEMQNVSKEMEKVTVEMQNVSKEMEKVTVEMQNVTYGNAKSNNGNGFFYQRNDKDHQRNGKDLSQ